MSAEYFFTGAIPSLLPAGLDLALVILYATYRPADSDGKRTAIRVLSVIALVLAVAFAVGFIICAIIQLVFLTDGGMWVIYGVPGLLGVPIAVLLSLNVINAFGLTRSIIQLAYPGAQPANPGAQPLV